VLGIYYLEFLPAKRERLNDKFQGGYSDPPYGLNDFNGFSGFNDISGLNDLSNGLLTTDTIGRLLCMVN
jgi:hypothetical protein